MSYRNLGEKKYMQAQPKASDNVEMPEGMWNPVGTEQPMPQGIPEPMSTMPQGMQPMPDMYQDMSQGPANVCPMMNMSMCPCQCPNMWQNQMAPVPQGIGGSQGMSGPQGMGPNMWQCPFIMSGQGMEPGMMPGTPQRYYDNSSFFPPSFNPFDEYYDDGDEGV